jgi:hypothetical protein
MHEAHWIDDVENGQCQVEDHGKQWQEGPYDGGAGLQQHGRAALRGEGLQFFFRQVIGSPVRPRTLPP